MDPFDNITGRILNTFSVRNSRSGGRVFPAGVTNIGGALLVTSWIDDMHYAIKWDENHIDAMRSIMDRYVTPQVHFIIEKNIERNQHGLI